MMSEKDKENNIQECLLLEEVELRSERVPRYFRKRKTYYSVKPQLQDFDRRTQMKLRYEDNKPY